MPESEVYLKRGEWELNLTVEQAETKAEVLDWHTCFGLFGCVYESFVLRPSNFKAVLVANKGKGTAHF
ncbi:MAG: hypothetical protein WCK85_12880, partial [Chlorobium sp.]